MRHILAVVPVLLLAGCDDRPDQWDAVIYPGDDLIEFERIRGFKSFELCREAALDRLARLRPDGGGSFECGHKCEPYGSVGDLEVCEETRDSP